jgi:hypothetical protein
MIFTMIFKAWLISHDFYSWLIFKPTMFEYRKASLDTIHQGMGEKLFLPYMG